MLSSVINAQNIKRGVILKGEKCVRGRAYHICAKWKGVMLSHNKFANEWEKTDCFLFSKRILSFFSKYQNCKNKIKISLRTFFSKLACFSNRSYTQNFIQCSSIITDHILFYWINKCYSGCCLFGNFFSEKCLLEIIILKTKMYSRNANEIIFKICQVKKY